MMYAGDAYCVAVGGSTSAAASSASAAAKTTTSTTTTTSAAAAATTNANGYVMYTGNGTVAAGWPAMSQWLDFDTLYV